MVRYIARKDGKSWRIWDRKAKRWKSQPQSCFPGKELDRLNGGNKK